MSLVIDKLQLTLPANLGGRKHAITKLLSSELARFDWPASANINQLSTPAISYSAHQTNLGVARSIARQIHNSTVQHISQGGEQ